MGTWERFLCSDGHGFYERYCISNDKTHYFEITKWEFSDAYHTRYVRDGLVRIKERIEATDIEEAREIIVQKTLRSLHKTACYYDNLFNQINKEMEIK